MHSRLLAQLPLPRHAAQIRQPQQCWLKMLSGGRRLHPSFGTVCMQPSPPHWPEADKLTDRRLSHGHYHDLPYHFTPNYTPSVGHRNGSQISLSYASTAVPPALTATANGQTVMLSLLWLCLPSDEGLAPRLKPLPLTKRVLGFRLAAS